MREVIVVNDTNEVVRLEVEDNESVRYEVLWDSASGEEIPVQVQARLQPFEDARRARIEAEKKRDDGLAYLKETDWYVLRFAEKSIPIPGNIRTLRDAARAKADRS